MSGDHNDHMQARALISANQGSRLVNGGAYTEFHPSPAHSQREGHIRRGKTSEQVKAQMERIRANTFDLINKDQSRADEIVKRYRQAAKAADAYNMYHALGAKGSSNG